VYISFYSTLGCSISVDIRFFDPNVPRKAIGTNPPLKINSINRDDTEMDNSESNMNGEKKNKDPFESIMRKLEQLKQK